MNQFARFLLVGVANTALGFGVIFGCMYLANMPPLISNVFGYSVGLVVSFFLNKLFTFKMSSTRQGEFTKFLAVFAFAYGLNFLSLLFLIHGLEVHPGISQLLAGAVYVVVSYLMNKYFVFKIVAHRGKNEAWRRY